jgi:cellulose synthase/poly-beta-1,6-N-acetylglucosamine synthase-like glycosyltransferase
MTAPVALFTALYLLVGASLFVYGAHAWLMTALHHRHRRRDPRPGLPGDDRPTVTVQLPLFNEYYVAERLIDAVCALDWPRDRLDIQVLDDSTDDTADLVARLVAARQADGFHIRHLRRRERTGFKGGALREGLAAARGDFLAVFDADFLPPRDFLARTIPHFGDSRVGMVQARWGHLNEDYSLLTRVQAVALDGHFLVEQTARNRSGAFINFNGTAGVWRREAILDAGNWQDDTLTEDLDLSYRAQMTGWRFVFLPELVCPAELPADVDGFKGQQFRWAKGSVQTARKLLPGLLGSRLPGFVKFQALIHLTNHAVYPLLLLLALLSLPALVLHEAHPEVRSLFRWATLFIVASFGHPVLYLYSQSRLKRDWLRQLLVLPVLVAMGMGIALNNVRAVVEALGGVSSPFLRTPKYDLTRKGDEWKSKRYRVPASALALAELGLGLYVTVALAYGVLHGQWLVVPFLALYAAGFLFVGSASLSRGLDRTNRPSETAAAA